MLYIYIFLSFFFSDNQRQQALASCHFILFSFFFSFYLSTDLCRHLKFTTPVNGYALHGHVIKNISLNLENRASCKQRCTIQSNCVSINIGPPINDKVLCQLSDSDHIRYPHDLTPREGFMYRGTEVRNLVSVRHLPIVLVKVAYYASGSARFLPKLCSNYARFSKLCYFLKKLFCAQTSQLTSSCIFQWWIRGVYPGQVVQALVYPLCSRYLVDYLDVSSLHLTGLAWRPPF